MNEPLTPMEERDALAAELALGVLTGEARGDALRLRLSDPVFATRVLDWERRLAPLHNDWEEIAPHDAVWDAVAARIAVTSAELARKVRRWRAGALLTGGVAAALALTLVMRPAPAPIEPAEIVSGQIAMAQMTGAADGPVVMARYDPRSAELKLRVSGIKDGATAPELWIIPEGGKPVSLGMIARAGNASMTMPMRQRPMMADGATLAVTMEPSAGAPHAAPSSAPVAAGKISFI